MSFGELPGTLTTISLSAIRNAAALLGVYLLTLVLYRLYFHPLASYPGHKEEGVEGKESPRDAFTPFSIGARGCIGKSVAYMEMRLVVGRLAWGWEWEEVRSKELVGQGWKVKEGEFELRDHFTSRKYGPMLRFTKREGI